MVNTFDAHRLAHHAKSQGLGNEMHERLMRAQLIEGENLGDVDTLVRLAEDIGVEGARAGRDQRPVHRGRARPTSARHSCSARPACRSSCWTGSTACPGAQPVEVFASALRTALENAAA